jgi:hypothetical protein
MSSSNGWDTQVSRKLRRTGINGSAESESAADVRGKAVANNAAIERRPLGHEKSKRSNNGLIH